MQINGNYVSSALPYQNTHAVTFSEKFDVEKLIDEKEVEASAETKIDYNQRALESIGSNAPENVKKAWMEAANEVGANGFGLLPNGMWSHISQFMIQSGIAWLKGETGFNDVLGNSVESAILATKKALYDLDNPLEPNATRSIEVQQARIKEREFYVAFLDKLQNL